MTFVANTEYAAQWSSQNPENPSEVKQGSNKKYWWQCTLGHEWQATAKHRKQGQGCPFCAGNRVWPGFNDLATTDPQIAEQWVDTGGLLATEVTRSSAYEATWRGQCGHEWAAPVRNRLRSRGCPYCAGKRVLPGFNDLATKNPELAREWHPTRNPITPQEVTQSSNKTYWWMCEQGHEWEAQGNNRARGQGCPYCNGKRAIEGQTDLETLNPELVKEWHPTRNPEPMRVHTPGSDRKVWWQCEKGHEWEAIVHNRARGAMCPSCAAARTISSGEEALAEFIKALGLRVEQSDRTLLAGREVDILVPDRKVAIEFNGIYWHSEKYVGRDYHAGKSRAAEEGGYQLLHVWEDDWQFRRLAVERMIARKLGVSQEPRYNARSLEIRELSTPEAREFQEANHVQGFVGGTHFALSDEEVRAVVTMKFTGTQGEYRLERYATNGIVRGGFSKLLKTVIRELGATRIITFADRGVSDGGLYAQNGFVNAGEIAPDYKYVVGARREHKFNYRKRRFQRDPHLQYEEGLTERQLAELNGLERIYDAGKVRWVLDATT